VGSSAPGALPRIERFARYPEHAAWAVATLEAEHDVEARLLSSLMVVNRFVLIRFNCRDAPDGNAPLCDNVRRLATQAERDMLINRTREGAGAGRDMR